MPETLAAEAGIPVGLVACGAAYAALTVRLERRGALTLPVRISTSFVVGLMAVAVALVGPVDALAHEQFAGHMLQHLLLVSVAAPLLAAGRPIEVLDAMFDRPSRRPPGTSALVTSAALQVTVLLGWHVPWAYDLALRNDPVHVLEHATLLGSSFVMWWCLVRSVGAWRGAALIVLFLASLPPMIYGVGLTLARTSWYGSYSVADQQVAGVLMWAYGGAAVVVGGVALFAHWLVTAQVDA